MKILKTELNEELKKRLLEHQSHLTQTISELSDEQLELEEARVASSWSKHIAKKKTKIWPILLLVAASLLISITYSTTNYQQEDTFSYKGIQAPQKPCESKECLDKKEKKMN